MRIFRQVNKKCSADDLDITLPATAAATAELKNQGVRFSMAKSADHSLHTIFLENMTKESKLEN